MVDETRDPTRSRSKNYEGSAAPKSQSKVDFFKRPENANALPGGTENTAGGKIEQLPTFSETIKSKSVSDFAEVFKTRCARESLLIGIAGGFVGGGLRIVGGGSIWAMQKAATWAVGSWMLVTLGAHQICSRKRFYEKNALQMAKEARQLEEAKRERRKQRYEMEKARAEREAREAEEKAAKEKAKQWWRIW